MEKESWKRDRKMEKMSKKEIEKGIQRWREGKIDERRGRS